MFIEMAPMEGITNYIYRQVFAKHFGGIDHYYTPFISPNQTESLQSREWKELAPENNQGLVVIPQILTKNPDHFLWAAHQAASLGYEEVNYNLGYPSGTVVSKGKGAGMLRNTHYLDQVLEKIYGHCPIRVSIKTRIGVADPAEFEDILAVFQKYPLARLIIHPRVQKEFYKGTVHKEIYQLAADYAASTGSGEPYPSGSDAGSKGLCLVFNGNLATIEDCQNILKAFPSTGGLMLGRGLLTDPALALKLKAWKKDPENAASKDFSAPSACRLTMDAFASFHEDLVRRNSEVLQGSHQVLHRLKEFWPYWYVNFTNGEKYWKRVRKARYFSDYQDTVSAIIRQEEIIPGAHFQAYSIR
ncbi:MAG: tRNA-dihydrouridine synthase family protein [Firmicutes bacterium]|nr:tRNA-dihydrouridine synthase family protein [Bacillota bacterium]